jgi:hypothetical protein
VRLWDRGVDVRTALQKRGHGPALVDLEHALVLLVENSDGFARLETEARLDAGYPLLGVVSDLGPGSAGVHRDHFGAVPFQACRVHFDRRLDSDIPKFSWSKKAPLYAEFKDRIRAVLYASSIDEAHASKRPSPLSPRRTRKERNELSLPGQLSLTSVHELRPPNR